MRSSGTGGKVGVLNIKPHRITFKTVDEVMQYMKDLMEKHKAHVRSECNPMTGEYWVEILWIEGEVITPLLKE